MAYLQNAAIYKLLSHAFFFYLFHTSSLSGLLLNLLLK